MLRNMAISTSFKNPQTPIENLWAEVQPANQCLLASCCPYKRLPEPALGKGEKGPCPGPCAWEPLCDTAAFLSSSFHVTARMAKFCSSPVTYCKTEDIQVLRYVASQNLRRIDTDTVAEMTSSRAADHWMKSFVHCVIK